MAAAVVRQSPRPGFKAPQRTLAEGQRKLPRPIVFWSLNEKTAYRRNRVVQTRMNMVMDDIATQRETSRKTIRYEAHKFRQKNNKYYIHPLGLSDETNKGSNFNIAPPNWRPPDENQATARTQNGNSDSEEELECDYENEAGDNSPRKKGIITRAKKPAVSFSMYKEVKRIENDLKIDDIDDMAEEAYRQANEETITAINNPKFRALSAPIPNSREVPDLPGQKRQQSAFPSLRSSSDNSGQNNVNDKYKSFGSSSEGEGLVQNRKMLKLQSRSENYFDRSKAAYQLREELKKRARLRKQGVKTTVFTLKDAINLEKEKFLKSNDKVEDYIKRIEELKRAENPLVNKWTRNAIESELNI